MLQANVDAVRAIYGDWAKGNFRSGVGLFDTDLLFILQPEFPEAGRYLGIDAVNDYMRDFLAAWENLTIGAEEFIEAGDSVVVAVHQRAVGRESGTPAELRYFSVWTFRGPKAIRLESFRGRAEALEAVGLRE